MAEPKKEPTYERGKVCAICKKPIPDDFLNMLCWEHYNKQEEAKKKVQEAQENKAPLEGKPDTHGAFDLGKTKNGIANPDYIENPEAPDKEQWETNVNTFKRNGVMLWKGTRQIYTYLKQYCLDRIVQHPQYPKFIWRPKIVDVGCGCGVGSNVLSQEADFVWGIDKNKRSIMFAKECFERVKNGIYYSSQVTFDNIDIFEETRTTMQFDMVVAVEIIEHVSDYKKFLKIITEKFTKRNKNGSINMVTPTEFFLTTPNRNNKHIKDATPFIKYHVREWTAPEFYNVLKEVFDYVGFYNAIGIEIPYEEIATTTHTPLIAKCLGPKI